MPEFGLLGKNIDYSFSRTYFGDKFKREQLPFSYVNFDISEISKVPEILARHPELKGLNVTIPYKEAVIPYLHELDATAEKIGAVNTIKIDSSGNTKGYNTDYWGFQKALEAFLPLKQKTALILGTGGASKAIAYALRNLQFDIQFVSRKASESAIDYDALNEHIIQKNFLIINCTPLGTYPRTAAAPPIPYHHIGPDHLLFDLIYNPSETTFLKNGKARGAQISNGLKMLENQAEKAWFIWNS